MCLAACANRLAAAGRVRASRMLTAELFPGRENAGTLLPGWECHRRPRAEMLRRAAIAAQLALSLAAAAAEPPVASPFWGCATMNRCGAICSCAPLAGDQPPVSPVTRRDASDYDRNKGEAH